MDLASTSGKNGNKYTGVWKNGKREGEGRMDWINGDVYTGEWKDGMKSGQGKFEWRSQGDVYLGE